MKDVLNQVAVLNTPSDLDEAVRQGICEEINPIVADLLALYLKTKNYHWHMSGRHFRDYHLLLDEQADQLIETVDPMAERVRKLGGITIRSIGHVAQLQRVTDNDDEFVTPKAMLIDLMDENKKLATVMREAHTTCEETKDIATASLLEQYVDEAERRLWFLFEASRDVD